MPLPSLQGLAVLNIPSYAGGINFWGGTKEDNVSVVKEVAQSATEPPKHICFDVKTCFIYFVQNFGAPSFDDKKLEVVAVFGSMQMAMSRVINLQHHRIAQVKCRLDIPAYS